MTYSKEELAKKFGDVFNEQGGFDKDGASDDDVKRLMGNKELRTHFTGKMGRSTDDWDDGYKSVNDLSTVLKDMLSEDTAAPVAADPKPEQMSDELASAKAGVKAYEEHILPNKGTIIMGLDKGSDGKSTNTQNYLDAFALNLAKNLEPVNADGSSRESKLRQEEDAVEGFA